MTAVYLTLTLSLLWLNLAGLGLAGWRVLGDYAVGRVAGVLVCCMGLFFVEHFVGLGATHRLLPLTSLVSAWLVWKHRRVLRENWRTEALFALGFCYCLAWRGAFPDIDTAAEKIPDLVFIQDYMTGERLPATDRWLPPHSASFYYGLQHYSAGFLARWLGVGGGVSYQFSFCVLVGLVTCAAGTAAGRLGSWKLGSWLVPVTLLIGGNGVVVALQVLLKNGPTIWQSSRFLGLHIPLDEWTELGRAVQGSFNPAADLPSDQLPVELPMDPLSYAIFVGEYHPPLIGFLLLAFACLLMVSLEMGAQGRTRFLLHALLAGTIPMTLIGNIWVAPLQILLVGAWALWRAFRRERGHWLPLVAGGAFFLLLAYPHLVEFTTQPISGHSAIRFTPVSALSGWARWLLMFWPVAGLLLLGLLARERRAFAAFLFVLWVGFLLFTEFVYNDDGFAATWERYNSTLKWWPWVYSGIVLTVGAANLASARRLCRWGSALILLTICTFSRLLFGFYSGIPKENALRLEGSAWLLNTPELRDLSASLSARPDGIALESGHIRGNNETGVVSLFSGKSCFLGWVVHEEVLWRGMTSQVGNRLRDIGDFYEGRQEDPLKWLENSRIRYVLWLPRDNLDRPAQFARLRAALAPRFHWHGVPGPGGEIGFWELFEDGVTPDSTASFPAIPTPPAR